MKISVETKILQDLTSKAIKGSGRNPAIIYTLGLNIEVVGSDLVLTTTDNINTLKVIGKDVCSAQSNGFFTCVDSDIFSKLVAKTTSKLITLETTEKTLKFKGNGEYTLDVYADKYNNNEIVRIPELTFNEDVAKSGEIDVEVLKTVLTYNKPNVGRQGEKDSKPELTGYYVDNESVITYNGNTATVNMGKLIKNDDFGAVLLSYNFVELMSIITGKNITMKCDNNKVKVVADDIEIVGALMNNKGADKDGNEKELFPAKPLKAYADGNFNSSCVVSKADILDSLDRLGLFIVQEYKEASSIRMTFTGDKLILSNVDDNENSTNTETLEYISSGGAVDFTKKIDLQRLRAQINISKDNEVELFYTPGRGLVINTKMVYQAIPFVQDYNPNEIRVG